MRKIEVTQIEDEQHGLFKRYGRIIRLRTFLPKYLMAS